MKDVIYDIVREFDDGKHDDILNGHRFYASIYDRKDDEPILVFDDWNSVRAMETVLLPIAQQEKDFNKRRDDEYDTSAIEFIVGDDNWTFGDEGFMCSECGNWHFYEVYNGTSYQNYHIFDGIVLCEDCIKTNPDAYIEDIIDNPDSANTIFDDSELQNLGFERINADDDPYEHGWYGRVDDPKEIYEQTRKIYPNSDILFSTRNTYNPWEPEFDVWVRKADEDVDGTRYYHFYTKEVMTFEEMEAYCKENYDYGDPTNTITYMSEWWKEYDFEQIA